MTVVVDAVNTDFDVTNNSSAFETCVYKCTGLAAGELVRIYHDVNGDWEPLRDETGVIYEFKGQNDVPPINALKVPGDNYRFWHPAHSSSGTTVSIVRVEGLTK